MEGAAARPKMSPRSPTEAAGALAGAPTDGTAAAAGAATPGAGPLLSSASRPPPSKSTPAEEEAAAEAAGAAAAAATGAPLGPPRSIVSRSPMSVSCDGTAAAPAGRASFTENKSS